jgi:alpha-soluble NSF attachment protein
MQYKMKLEAAAMRVEMGQYAEASKLYEAVANEYVSNNLLKYSAKDLYMNTLLCVMAEGDTTTAMSKREEFRMSDVNFESSRQDKLVTECLNAMLGSNPEDFATAVAEWESMTKLDAFRVKLLLAAKDTIAVGGPDPLDDGDDLDLT